VHRIGRTARLGAEGDAISFACERYAMSLPDIESYIEQKLPVAPVERELLIPLPRPQREVPAGAANDGDDESESIGTIFREAREQRAADEQRRGGGPRSRTGDRGARSGSGGRRDGGRDAGPRRERAPTEARPPRVEPAAVAPAQATPAVSTVVANDAERAPRKRRRRRGGRRIEGAEGATPNATSPANNAAKASGGKTESGKPGLFARIGHGLKKLITRAPSSQH
jgi:ATP-dependent RNA helicase RhlB